MSEPPFALSRVQAVVMGASAGGIQALSMLLPALPPQLAVPVFIVLHLPRERPSLLVEVFRNRCAVPVCEAVDKEPVVAGTVYFAPPDYHLLVDRGPQLALSTDAPVYFSRPSIDALFESAADVYGSGLLGILLTGANEDGAAGLQAVQKAGGISVAQDPEGAYSPIMPVAAIRRGKLGGVLALERIADLLRGLAGANAPPASGSTARHPG